MVVPAHLKLAPAGTEVRLLVLASGPGGCAGVDLASGALVRAHYSSPAAAAFDPYDVVSAELAADDQIAFAPDSIVVAPVPRKAGQLAGRRATRLLRPLLHPAGQHLLGSIGPAVPFWTLRADRPSLALVNPAGGLEVERAVDGLRCRFRWRRVSYDLPLDDPRLAGALSHPAAARLTGRTLARAVGWAPHSVLVALTPPRKGYCYKVVAALLARP